MRNTLTQDDDLAAEQRPFVVQPEAYGLQPGIDPLRLNQLLDQLEIEQFTVVQMTPRQHCS